jgi:hypothetical protein
MPQALLDVDPDEVLAAAEDCLPRADSPQTGARFLAVAGLRLLGRQQ